MPFAEKLRQRMKERGVTQEQLAAAIGTNQPQVSAWLNRGVMPSTGLVLRAAKYLDTTLDYLLNDEHAVPSEPEGESLREHYGSLLRSLAVYAVGNHSAHLTPAELENEPFRDRYQSFLRSLDDHRALGRRLARLHEDVHVRRAVLEERLEQLKELAETTARELASVEDSCKRADRLVAQHEAVMKALTAVTDSDDQAGAPPSERTDETESAEPCSPSPLFELQQVVDAWPKLVKSIGIRRGASLSQVRPSHIEPPNTVVVTLPAGYQWVDGQLDKPEDQERVNVALSRLLGRDAKVEFRRSPEPNKQRPAAPNANK